MVELHLRSQVPLTATLDVDAYLDFCALHGLVSDARAAAALGVERSVITRIRHGESNPGIPFLSGVVGFSGGWAICEDLFRIVPDRSPSRIASWRRRVEDGTAA